VLVLGHHADAVQKALNTWAPGHGVRRMGLHQVINPQPTDGQNSSLHLGLAKAQSLAPDWLMVALADQPLLEAQDLQDLVAAVKHAPVGTQMLQPQVTVPGQGALPGNPVMLRKVVMAELLQNGQNLGTTDLSQLPGGKEWRQRNPDHFHPWPTSNVHYRIDMDTPDDLAALKTQYGIQLVWGQGL
jgi:CTP:molybdopterin cytidylyltransferase MocA